LFAVFNFFQPPVIPAKAVPDENNGFMLSQE
jgi:hypothetical protein